MRWCRVIINTWSSWPHGDDPGFRSRGPRIHPLADYKNPPPLREHEGLRKYHRKRSGKPITIWRDVREIVIRAFVENLRELGYCVVVVSVNGRHLHALVELPDDVAQIRRIIGKCKQRA